MSHRDRALALVVAAVWGTNFIAMHYALDAFPPLFLAALRFLVIAVPTVIFVRPPHVSAVAVIGYGLGFGAIQFGFLFAAIDLGMPTGVASIAVQASAPLTLLLGVIFLRERPSRHQLLGMALAVAGLCALTVGMQAPFGLRPLLLTAVAAVGWAVGNIFSRQANAAEPMRLVLWMCVVPPLPLLTFSLAFEGPLAIAGSVRTAFNESWISLVALGYLVVVATLLATWIWTMLLSRYDASTVAPCSLMVPCVGLVAGWAVLNESPGWLELLASALLLMGVQLATRERQG